MNNDLELFAEFITEAKEIIDTTDDKLLLLEKNPTNPDLINAVFRGYHTIKGGAGFLELKGLIALCHYLENLFDNIRNGQIDSINKNTMNIVLEAGNEIRNALNHYESNPNANYEPPKDLLTQIQLIADNKFTSPQSNISPNTSIVSTDSINSIESNTEALNEYYNTLTNQNNTNNNNMTLPAKTEKKEVKKQTDNNQENQTHIKVETGRLDAVLTLASEVGLAKNRMGAAKTRILAKDFSDEALSELARTYNDLERVTSMLQNAVMRTRMQPIGRLFSKYPRLVRDLARTLDKNAELEITGHETEIDKGMIEDLADPLIHLIRNALDHGVESEAERLNSGKNPVGQITLNAKQEGDRIVIEISDDGRGINSVKLKEKARSKGLLSPAILESLTESQALELIFLPGLSTADKLSDISGRGVGMDVVKTNITKLGGEIFIKSKIGSGTHIEIRIPLTLAVMPALLLKTADQPLAVPLNSVQEILTLSEHQMQNIGGKPVINLRGEILSAIDLSEILGWGKSDNAPVAAVVDIGSKKAALLAQGFIGRDEVMVKALDGTKPKGVSGVVVDAKGEIVLILDLKELLGDTPSNT